MSAVFSRSSIAPDQTRRAEVGQSDSPNAGPPSSPSLVSSRTMDRGSMLKQRGEPCSSAQASGHERRGTDRAKGSSDILRQEPDIGFRDVDRMSYEGQGILRQRRKASPIVPDSQEKKSDSENDSPDEMDGESCRNVKLTLVEEVLLLGLKDKEGYTSFWNDSISTGLRGAILVELALHRRIELEKTGMRKKPLVSRRVHCVDGSPTGDAILDEALRHIRENSGSFSVPSWIDFLTGDTWNPINFRFHMRNVRERLAKSLVDKGVCNTQKQNFFIFDMTTHPLSNGMLKQNLIKRIQSLLLTKWKSELRRFKPRCLALLYLAHASDVLDNALANLTYVDFDLASKHTRELLSVDPDQEAAKYDNRMEVLWAVVSNYIK